MQRMHRFFVVASAVALTCVALTQTASADLLRPKDTRDFPDLTAFANGYQTYSYDPGSKTGLFQLANVPFLLTQGKNTDGSFSETNLSKSDDGIQAQKVTAVLDANGHLVDSPLNTFQVYGKVVLDGQTYSGLLLQGTPTAFGSQTLKPTVDGEDLFDMKLQITGGSMADLYGKNAYMRVTAEANSTFDGVFTSAFSSEKVMTNVHSISSLLPQPAPEPATLYVLLACGAGLFYRGRRRIAARDLGA